MKMADMVKNTIRGCASFGRQDMDSGGCLIGIYHSKVVWKQLIKVLLYLAVILVFLLDFTVIIEAPYYLPTYRGLYAMAISMLICVGADLIAGILAIHLPLYSELAT